MSAFFIDGSLQVPDAELSAVAGHHVVTASEWLRPRIQGIVEELRQRRADADTQRLVVERLQDLVDKKARAAVYVPLPSLIAETERLHVGSFFTWLCEACAPPLGPLEFIPDVGGNAPTCAVCDAPKPQRPCTAEQLTRVLRMQREHLALWEAGLAPGVLCACGHLNSEHMRGLDAPRANGRWFDCSQCTCLVLKEAP